MKKLLGVILLALSVLISFSNPILAESPTQIDFFYSETCPHCKREKVFLTNLQKEYPHLVVNEYPMSDPQSRIYLEQILTSAGKKEYLGSVPITVIGDQIFLGFDNEVGIGADIRNQIAPQNKAPDVGNVSALSIPLLGSINPSDHSLPILALTLGFLDGFNVCSLGALALILGLVLALRDRKKILLFGGIFIGTTATIYGILIFLWHKVFSLVAGYTRALEILIILLAVSGAVFFYREYLECKRSGPSCKAGNNKLVSTMSRYVQRSFGNSGNVVSLAIAIFSFAAVITIVEFPCSAALPVVFAGIITDAGVSSFTYIVLIALFVLMYMLDELVIYIIAVTKMSIWLSSPKFTMYAMLAEALLLMGIALYYGGSILGLI